MGKLVSDQRVAGEIQVGALIMQRERRLVVEEVFSIRHR